MFTFSTVSSKGRAFGVFVLVAIISLSLANCGFAASQVALEGKRKALELLDLSPAVFVENKGQWDSAIRYGFDGKGTKVSFTDGGPVFRMLGPSDEKGHASQAVFSASFVGAGRITPVGLDASASRTNYYIGSDSFKWRSDVPSFGRIAYYGIYDGVDLYTWGKRSGLKYEFHVAPGASWRQVVIRYDGVEGVSLDDRGALHVKTSVGEMVDDAPVVYQETPSGPRELKARFRIVDNVSYGFEIAGDVDPSLTTVIDPAIAWGSYFGGSGDEPGGGLWIDNSGNIFVGAITTSANFPTTSGAMQRDPRTVIFAKFAPSGTLQWATYFGGTGNDSPNGPAPDSSGNFWFSGSTDSTDFPTTSSAFQKSVAGGIDGFISKITSSGTLAFSSYFGGSGDEDVRRAVCDGSGNCWVTGTTDSSDFYTTGGAFQSSLGGGKDMFVMKVSAAGSRTFSSYFGGSGDEKASEDDCSIAVDSTGDLWTTGETVSSDLPTTADAYQSALGGNRDALVAQWSPSGALLYASYIGGSNDDQGQVVLIASTGDALLVGGTGSQDFPVTPGGGTVGNGWYVFTVKITPWHAVAWGRAFGAADGSTDSWNAAVDSAGSLWVAGMVNSPGFPVTPDAFQGDFGGGTYDGFAAKISPFGSLQWASYVGGSGDDEVCSIAVDAWDNVWMAGSTNSSNFPTSGNAFQKTLGGGWDAFIVKIKGNGELGWSTYLGGTGTDGRQGDDSQAYVTPDAAGNAWVQIVTNSSNMPTTPGAFQTTAQGGWDTYFAKISSPTITTASLPGGMVGIAYSRTVAGRAGTTPYAWSISAGNLPAGLSIGASSGIISGTPTQTGTFSFTVRITDDVDAYATKPFSIAIASALAVTTTSLPADTVGIAYSRTLAATGGAGPYTWSKQSGNLPVGLSLGASTGAIAGTPTTAGTSSFTVKVTDASSATATKALSIVVHAAPSIAAAALPNGTLGVAYSQTLAATGGTPPLVWSISAGSLPDGLSLTASTGVISGTPTTAAVSSFTARVADSLGATATRALAIAVDTTLAVATTSLPDGTIGVAYSQTVEAVGGVPPYTWSVSSGSLPAGLSLDASTGVISGAPTAYATSTFTVQARDSQVPAKTAARALSIEVYPAQPSIDTSWLKIKKLRIGLPASVGHDSLVLQGTCNIWPSGGAPQTVALRLDSTWSLVVDVSSWKRVGKSNVYTARQAGVSCKMTYWVNRTSKCLFAFTGSRQTLQGFLPSLPNVPVRLQIGSAFDETVVAAMTVKNRVAKLASPGPLPLFYPQKLAVTRNLRLAGRDGLSFSGKVFLGADFDPALDGVTMAIGPYEILLPAGAMPPAKRGVVKYTTATAHGKMTFKIDNKTHALTVTATGVDLSDVSRTTEISLSITNHAGADWDYGLFMSENRSGTLYKY